jgi:phosphoserine phosphatase
MNKLGTFPAFSLNKLFKMKSYFKFFMFFLIFSVLLTGCRQDTSKENKTSEELTKKENKDPLPSWKDTSARKEIMAYVDAVTDTNYSGFIPIADRIAVFDNDGTLWSEQPAYFQLFFIIDRINVMAKDHPEWKNKQPFKAVLENDMKTLSKYGEEALVELAGITHGNMSSAEFQQIVKDWVKTAKHPTKKVTYDKLVFQPMIELLQYLRANRFKTYIVSGGGLEFMRAIVTEVYGIPEEQILGSYNKTEFVYNDGKPYIKRSSKIAFIDDKEGKPENIHRVIGKKPVFAAGNSDGDLAMMQWTASSKHKSFMLYVHHTDAEREWAYDRDSHIGKLDKGLDQAIKDGWTVIDMKNDWKVVYPFKLK